MARCCDKTGSAVPVSSMDQYTAARGTSALAHETVDLSRAKCFGAKPVIEVSQSQPAKLTLWVFDKNGAAVDLTNSGTLFPRFVVKDSYKAVYQRFHVHGTIGDALKGEVHVDLNKTNTCQAGIYIAQLIIEDAQHVPQWVNTYWLMINQSLTGRPSNAISIADVRLMLMDECPAQNFLLDDFEFDDSQIMACIRMPIDEFNEKYQPKTNFVPRNFPYRFHWVRAAAGYLLGIAAQGYARNHLPYQAGGISVDDKNKSSVYTQLSQQLLAEWRQFVREQKIQLNIEGGYGRLKSAYTRGRII